MLNVKKLLGDVDISKDLSLLLFIGGLYALGSSLSNTFVNIYLWKQSGNFVDIAIYNLAVVVLQPLTFIVAGRWAKKVDRVIVLRIGVIFFSFVFCGSLIFWRKFFQVSHHAWRVAWDRIRFLLACI